VWVRGGGVLWGNVQNGVKDSVGGDCVFVVMQVFCALQENLR
jgi:hypothetical protein